jgi:hypothetical protein
MKKEEKEGRKEEGKKERKKERRKKKNKKVNYLYGDCVCIILSQTPFKERCSIIA